ncbi:GntR family transcriptional regulator [Desulfotalea psychrophila]|uniref:Related to transcription regulator (GntR family) n=1 Tax=Desulfotalea psychrophila (strain LSv54 / DSM 12343) TaxID=177439 RepID=Q6AKP9_DESPS|nr:GntR family transcriptional regulator [Desulfotalea psychrophila]CAG37076.1 related to transcription regulator (GntR family) [Desulfotalea psychrophila LSv54]
MLSASIPGNHLLRVQVYNYLEKQMQLGNLKPGSSISVNTMIKELGVSRTPLREALILLQEQGFVSIQPQRGVKINALNMDDVKDIYEILGGIESSIFLSVFDNLREKEIQQMKMLNNEIELALANEDIIRHNQLNVDFHDTFLGLSNNKRMLRYVGILKMQLYDFPRRNFGIKWNNNNLYQHRQFIQLIEEGKAVSAADYLRDIHWDFDLPDSFQIISGAEEHRG